MSRCGFHRCYDPIGRPFSRALRVPSEAMSTPAPQGQPAAGRRRYGLAVGIVIAVGCSLLLLGVDLVQSVDSSARSVAPFLIALPLALLPVPFLIALVLLLDRLEPEPRAHLGF